VKYQHQGDLPPGSTARSPLVKATYCLGLATRHTVDLFRIVFGLVSNKVRSRTARPSARRSRISAGLSKMQRRLESIERTVMSGGARRARDVRAGITDAADVAAFAAAMGNPDAGVRRFALGTIGGQVEKTTQHIIIEALHDPDPAVRAAAASASARAHLSAAVFSLIIMLSDSSEDVVRAAEAAIEAITGRRVDLSHGQSEPARNKKIEQLKVWWKENRFADLAKGLDREA
jgi:HEAT repeat protein